MTKTATPKAPTVRSVNAALRAAGIRTYKRPPATRTHNGQIVQSIGWYGVKVTQWSDTEVRVTDLVGNERNAERAVAKVVAALPGFCCQIDRRFGLSVFVTVGR